MEETSILFEDTTGQEYEITGYEGDEKPSSIARQMMNNAVELRFDTEVVIIPPGKISKVWILRGSSGGATKVNAKSKDPGREVLNKDQFNVL